jgi:penicillin-binding protein 1A
MLGAVVSQGTGRAAALEGQIAGGGLPARIWRDFMTRAVGTTPARNLAPPLQAPVPVEALNGSLTVPIEGTGYEVGFEVTENGVTISAQPGEEPPVEEPPAERPGPVIVPPPAPPAPRDEPPPEDEDGL